jgi:hypothetical protein
MQKNLARAIGDALEKAPVGGGNRNASERTTVLSFKRVHDSGSEALITQYSDGCRIQINLREPNRNPGTITGYLAPTLELAKEVADKEISKYGHVCKGSCKDWIKF